MTLPRRNPSSEPGHAAASKPPTSTVPAYILHEFSLSHDHSGRSATGSSGVDGGRSGHSRTNRSRSITATEGRRNSKPSSREMFTTEVSGLHEVVSGCGVGRTMDTSNTHVLLVQASASTADTSDPDNIEQLLIKRITSRPWFPRDTSSPHLKTVIETLRK